MSSPASLVTYDEVESYLAKLQIYKYLPKSPTNKLQPTCDEIDSYLYLRKSKLLRKSKSSSIEIGKEIADNSLLEDQHPSLVVSENREDQNNKKKFDDINQKSLDPSMKKSKTFSELMKIGNDEVCNILQAIDEEVKILQAIDEEVKFLKTENENLVMEKQNWKESETKMKDENEDLSSRNVELNRMNVKLHERLKALENKELDRQNRSPARDLDTDNTEKYKKYEADYVRRIKAKYFSKKNLYGGNIFENETTIENEVIKSSRWPSTRSYTDPVQSFEDQSRSSSTSAAETSANLSSRKYQSKKSSS